MTLQAKFTPEQIDYIFDHFYKRYYSNDSYKYIMHLKDIGFTIMLLPHDQKWTFNAKIILQTAYFEAEYVPHSIIDVLKFLDWSVTGMDIAFDYLTSHDNSFTYKHHGNISHEKMIDEHGHQSLYMGAFNPNRKNNRSIMYDRNEKEYSLDMSDHARHLYSNRFEVKLKWKIGAQLLNYISHQQIEDELKKRIFIVDTEEMDTDGQTKRKFRLIKSDYDKLKNYYTANDRRKLRKVAKAHREPLENIYRENQHHLYGNFEYKESSTFIFKPDNKKTPNDVRAPLEVAK